MSGFEKTEVTENLKPAAAGKLLLGLIAGLILIQILNLGWLFSLLLLGVFVLFIVSLDGYNAWLVLLVATTMSGLRYYGISGTRIRPDQVVLIIIMAGWILALLIGKRRFNKVPLLFPVILFIAVNFFATLYSPNGGGRYKDVLLLSVYVMMYIISVSVLQDHPDRLRRAVKILLALGVVQAAYALAAFVANHAGVNLGGVGSRQVGTLSLQGTFEEPNFLGAFEAVIGLMFLSFLTSPINLIKRGVAIVSLILILVVLALTFTRAAWVGFAIALMLLIFLQKPARNIFNPRAAVAALAITAIVVVVIVPFANNLSSGVISQRVGALLDFSGGSGQTRVQAQKLAIEDWRSSALLGKGTMSLDTNSLENGASEEEKAKSQGWVYSSVIQALHDTGIIGLMIFLWIQGGIFLEITRGYLRTKDNFYRASLVGFGLGSVAMLISSQASSFMWLGFFWIFSGMAVAVSQVARREGVAESKSQVKVV